MPIGLLRSALIITLALFAVPASVSAATTPERIIVHRHADVTGADRRELRANADVTFARNLTLPSTELVLADAGEGTHALRALNADPDVAWAEPDRRLHASTNDTYFPLQWALENTGQDVLGVSGLADADIDAPEAWLRSRGAGVTVAVVDTGVNSAHPDLAGNLTGNPGELGAGRESNGIDDDVNGYVDDWHGWDFAFADNDPNDNNGHGSHVTGIIAAQSDNAAGISGVAPDTRVVALRALDASGSGYLSDIADAFDYAGDLGIVAVNASLGADGDSPILNAVIASHPGTLYVVAAGNGGWDGFGDNNDFTPVTPCNAPSANVLCVGATDSRDQPTVFSNYGRTTVDLFAPGNDVESAWMGAGAPYVPLSGTSMAAPHVTGVLALLRAANPSASASALRAATLASVDPLAALTAKSVSGGRLNAAAALAAPLVTTPVAAPAPQLPAPAPPAPATRRAARLTLLRAATRATGHAKPKVTYSVSHAATVTFTVRQRSCVGGRGRATGRFIKIAGQGRHSFVLTNRLVGCALRPGSYLLRAAVGHRSRQARFTVRR